MKRTVSALLIVSLMMPTLALAKVGSDKAAYFGGSVAEFSAAKDPVEGVLDIADADALVLHTSMHNLRIRYAKIEDLEYGQKAGRRVGAAVGYTVLLGPLGLLTLFSKKRNHYLTIAYKDDNDKDQVAVLELGKNIVRTTLPVVRTKSGKDISFQDEEARKAAGMGTK